MFVSQWVRDRPSPLCQPLLVRVRLAAVLSGAKKFLNYFFILISLFISLTEILKITTRISIITNVFSQWKCSVLYFKNETQNKDHLKVLIVLVIKWSSCQNLFILISNNVNNIPFKVINLGGFKIYIYIFFPA